MLNALTSLRTPIILLVDDERPVRMLTRRILEMEGYSIYEAENGETALAMFEATKPDIILMDVLMPGLDGIETCRRIQELPDGPFTPVLIVTALEDQNTLKRAFEAGAMDFVTKPVQWIVMKHRIRRLLAMRQMQRAIQQERIDEALGYRLEFEKIITSISTQFINYGPAQVDAGINDALQRIARFAGVDRSYVILFADDGEYMINSHEWCAEDVEPRREALQAMPVADLPWWVDQLANGCNIYLPTLEDLPQDAYNERVFLLERDVQSTIAVPMLYNGRLAGFLGFDSLRLGKTWSDDLIALLKIAGEIFINTLQNKRIEEALQLSERQLRQITDTMLDTVYRTNEDGLIEYASPSCWHVLGYRPEELVGLSIYSFVHADDLAEMQKAVRTVGEAQYRCRHANGNYLWLETLSNLIFDDESRVSGIVFASRDITERKRAEHELQDLNRLKTEFLSTAAHELRTPLTSIRGFSEILLTRQLDTTRQTRYLKMINDQATQLGRIIDDLLDISRLEAKRHLSLTLDAVDITELVQAAAQPFIEANDGHTFSFEGMENYPPVHGDAFRLGQVMKNLLSNAVKYSPSGGDIKVRLLKSGKNLVISVTDPGIGMTAEQQAHLFEKFYRADASNTTISGTGLGLSISKLIVELHGGRIWAESVYGEGATFYFTLPLNPALAAHQFEREKETIRREENPHS